MRSTALRFVVLVLAILVVTAWLMAPRRSEMMAIMRDQSQQVKIIALLEPRLAESPDEPYLLATLARAYREAGDQWRAAELLERYVAQRPADAAAFGQLADLYRAIGDPQRRLERLQQAVALRAPLSRALELAGLYREAGRADDERALLADHEEDLTRDSGLLLRLAQLRAAAGDRDGAIRTLMRPAVLTAAAPAVQPPAERFYLAELLLADGRAAEALHWATRWVAQWHEPWRATQLLRRFVAGAPPEVAGQLADRVAATHPEIRFYLAAEFRKAGAAAIARRLLAGWAVANPAPSADEVMGFVAACAAQDAAPLVWAAFAAALARPAPDAVLGRFLDAIIAEFGIGALAPFWAALPPTVIAGNPLLGARLALQARQEAVARRLLAALPPASLRPADRRQWFALLAASTPAAERFAILARHQASGTLPGELLGDYLGLALQLGDERAYREALPATTGLTSTLRH